MIKGSFNNTDVKVLAKLQIAVSKITQGLRVQMDREMMMLRTYIVTQKLEGQVLHHRSGTLIDSTQTIPTTATDTTITGGVTSAGGPAFYGVFFEKGGTHSYTIRPVSKKALAFFSGDGPVPLNASVTSQVSRNLSSRNLSLKSAAIEKFGNLGGVVVKSVNHPPVPHLPYMSPSLNEKRDEIRDNLQRAAVDAGIEAMNS